MSISLRVGLSIIALLATSIGGLGIHQIQSFSKGSEDDQKVSNGSEGKPTKGQKGKRAPKKQKERQKGATIGNLERGLKKRKRSSSS